MQTTSPRTGWPYFNPLAHLPLPATLPDGSPWPRITVVTPSYNQGRYIEQTILSVLNQNYPDVEHIVMDGGSTDETRAVLDQYRPRVAHAVSEKDRGQSHAINKGMALATGHIVTWLNSDDMLAPGALAAAALAFHTSGADMIAGICRLYRDGHYVGAHLTSCPDNDPLPLNDLLDLDHCWNAGQFFYQPETMYTRDLWQRAGARVDESLYYSMDYELWLRFALAGAKLHVIGRPIAHFRMHEEQKTSAPAKFKAELTTCRDNFIRKHNLTPTPVPARTGAKQFLRMTIPATHAAVGRAIATAGHHVTVVGKGAEAPTADLDLTAPAANVIATSNEFQPIPKQAAREILGLPADPFLLVADPALLDHASAAAAKLHLPTPRSLVDTGADPLKRSLLLSAADLVLTTTPTTLAEAAACGTATVSKASEIQPLHDDGEHRERLTSWSRLHAENEFSPAAAVHRVHNALTAAGVADRLPLSRKIGFTPTPTEVTVLAPTVDEPIEETFRLVNGFGPWQDASREKGLPRCCWALAPAGRVEVRAARPGRRHLTIGCRNFQAGQSVQVIVAGRVVAEENVPVTTKSDHTLNVPVEVSRGVNPIELRYTKWAQPAPRKPSRAILITRISCDPVA
jgi:hypothetical protein